MKWLDGAVVDNRKELFEDLNADKQTSLKETDPLIEHEKIYRGSLYDPVNANAVTPDPRLTDPLYRDKNGLPIMFPGAKKLRAEIRKERQKAQTNQSNPLPKKRTRLRKPVSEKPKPTTKPKKPVDIAEERRKAAVLAKFQSKMKSNSLMKPDAVRSNG